MDMPEEAETTGEVYSELATETKDTRCPIK